jgi:hypothetical protein
MSKHKFLILMIGVMAAALFALSPGDALGQPKGNKGAPQEQGTKGVTEGNVTRDDVARYLGKVTPSEQEAAIKRNRERGLLPGIAGQNAQTPGSGASR